MSEYAQRKAELAEKIRLEQIRMFELSTLLDKERERYVKLLGKQPKRYQNEFPAIKSDENNNPADNSNTLKIDGKKTTSTEKVEEKKIASVVSKVEPVTVVQPVKLISVVEPVKVAPVEPVKSVESIKVEIAKPVVKPETNIVSQRLEASVETRQVLEHIENPKTTKRRPTKNTGLLDSVNRL